jgi:bile acid:Na+ symporter, BASS family
MRVIGDFLAWIGRRGTEGFALSIFLGLALPQLATQARPLLPVTIFCFTTVVFMRADFGVIGKLFARPAKLSIGVAWLILAPALLIGGALALIGRENLDPGLVLGLAILGAAPPIMSSPADHRLRAGCHGTEPGAGPCDRRVAGWRNRAA